MIFKTFSPENSFRMQLSTGKSFFGGFSIYQYFDLREFILLDMVYIDAICYSTLELANLQCFTFV